MRQCLAVDCVLFLFFLFFFAFRSASSLSPRPRIRRPTTYVGSCHGPVKDDDVGNWKCAIKSHPIRCRHPRLDWAVRCGDGGLLSIAHATPPSSAAAPLPWPQMALDGPKGSNGPQKTHP
ncbi:hypothetical protein BGZ61DRAFT_454706 [Ilyonectria robusta]|uniref:uncharacterized protein n=1 Tax=Ilyonectria robusta TaxID=1079257 RepID=UPI001E8D149D|nr:uncharacterized protein BGZ61DRAFT_454706 [Ilyonectria robusta]KAH8686592.1 hypothetical protein BGZ61DRAFT_454706 [Ilyonectria robusta]